VTHPARTMSYTEIVDGLARAKAEKLVTEHVGTDGLRLYCYSKSCVYDRCWNPITLMARGLIIDIEQMAVVATPFPKFFNCGEGEQTIPDLPFETFEKVDGSLIIIFYHAGEWKTATKGSLVSDQAKWAAQQLARTDLSNLIPGTTYLAEAIYRDNRIVVHYDHEGLVLLGAYDESGTEVDYSDIFEIAALLGWRYAVRHDYKSISDLIVKASILPASEEGFVVRFSNGLRLKIKGDEYRRIHALISRITPLAMWEAMQSADNLNEIRHQLPEEFWSDFDAITTTLSSRINSIVDATKIEADKIASWTDKEVGLSLDKFPADIRRFIFPYRKYGDLLKGRARTALFQSIRPTGNILPGYVPSYAVRRVAEEAT
jgi:RNA ligase